MFKKTKYKSSVPKYNNHNVTLSKKNVYLFYFSFRLLHFSVI